MQKYHRYLDLPFTLEKPNHFINGQWGGVDVQQSDVEPALDWLSSLGLSYLLFEGFYTPPHDELHIHTDTETVNDAAKINFTWGNPKSTMRWWTCDTITRHTWSTGHSYMQAKKEDCELVHEATIHKPSLINGGQLHSTYNPFDEGRWTISIVPKLNRDYLTWNEAIEAFGSYIY